MEPNRHKCHNWYNMGFVAWYNLFVPSYCGMQLSRRKKRMNVQECQKFGMTQLWFPFYSDTYFTNLLSVLYTYPQNNRCVFHIWSWKTELFLTFLTSVWKPSAIHSNIDFMEPNRDVATEYHGTQYVTTLLLFHLAF